MKYIYLAGPISNDDEVKMFRNLQRFRTKAYELRKLGYKVFSPPDHEPPKQKWEFYIALDVKWIVENAKKIEFMYFMKGWENSKGAIIERATAKLLGLKMIYEE